MKKFAIAIMAISLMTSTSAFAIGGKKGKKQKAQTCTQASCPKKGNCPETPTCYGAKCSKKCSN